MTQAAKNTDRLYKILKTIWDSTAVLNHLDIEHQTEMCAAIKEYENATASSKHQTTNALPRAALRPWEQYITCCECSHPLDDNRRMKDALKTNTTASWAKVNLLRLSEMAQDRGLPEWFVKEVRRIEAGITLLPDPQERNNHD